MNVQTPPPIGSPALDRFNIPDAQRCEHDGRLIPGQPAGQSPAGKLLAIGWPYINQ